MDEQVICAAVLTDDGVVVRGHRHCDCFATIARMGKLRAKRPDAQGFVTSANRFVNRTDAFKIQQWAGIPSAAPGGYRGTLLYSEDLY